MTSGMISKLAHLNLTIGTDEDEVIVVQSGFERLSKRKILWRIENFVYGSEMEQFEEERFQIEIEKNDDHRGSICIFNLTSEEATAGGWDLVLSYSNEVSYDDADGGGGGGGDEDDQEDGEIDVGEHEGRGNADEDVRDSDQNVFHFVEASIRKASGKCRWASYKTTLSNFADSNGCEIFRVNSESSLPLVSGCLVIEATFTILRKKPVETRKLDPSVGPATINQKPRTSFRRFLNSKDASDIKIFSSDGGEFYAHRVILRAESEVFDAMLKTDMTESQTGIIKLEDMSAVAVTFLLNFVYCGDILPFSVNGQKIKGLFREDKGTGISADEDNALKPCEKPLITVEEVLYVASKYRLEDVLDFIDHSFRRLCCKENVVALLELSKMHSLACKEYLKQFIMRHPGIMSKILETY